MIKPERTGKLKRGATAEDYESGIARKKQRSSNDSSCPDDSNSTPGCSKLGGGGGGGAMCGLSHRKEKPAEQLFRKDLISAMKMADTEPLQSDDYIVITDPWRMDWEKGVQVPVHPHEKMPTLSVRLITGKENWHGLYSFKLPRKYLHATRDDTYRQGMHELHEVHELSEQVCRYDLDELDAAWLFLYNAERELMGELPVEEWVMELVLQEIEHQCHNNMETMIKTVDGLGIEYDENVVCDVCRSPESEDCNEMVFCDSCDICVHQACYGVQKIPEGSWLCRVCALGIKPNCILCPNTGGAMKSTRSGSKWAHVSCALWIPEVSIGCPEKMEPITKISHIPSSRWALTCNLCRDRTGACIQCAVKTCKTAFHVTCAIQHNLDMKTILDDKNDDVQLKAYCEKHSKKKDGEGTPRKTEGAGKGMKEEGGMTEEEKNEVRSDRLEKLAKEFYVCTEAKDIADVLQLDTDMVEFIYSYWMLKRRANFDKPLLLPKMEEEGRLSKQKEISLLSRMRMFIHLRQDLERVRNLCYMVTRREKLRRQLYHFKQQVFEKQVQVVNSSDLHSFGTRDKKAVCGAHRLVDSVYDHHEGILRTARLAEIAGIEADAASSATEEGVPVRERHHHHGRRHHDRSNESVAKVSPNTTRHFSDCLSEITTPEKDVECVKICSPRRDNASQTDSSSGVKKLWSSLHKSHNRVKLHGSDVVASHGSRLRKRSNSLHSCGNNNNNNSHSSEPHKHKHQHKFSAMTVKCDAVMEKCDAVTEKCDVVTETCDSVMEKCDAVTEKRDAARHGGSSGKPHGRNGMVVAGSKRLVVGDSIREKVQSRLEKAAKPYRVLNGLRERVQRKIENFFQRSDDTGSKADVKENEPVIVADAPSSGKKDKSTSNGVIGCDLFHQNIFSSAIHGTGNGSAFGQIAKQAGFDSSLPAADGGATTPTRGATDGTIVNRTPEARRGRRKATLDSEAGNSGSLYGDVRPSCNRSPERDASRYLSSCDVTASPFGSSKKSIEVPQSNDSEADLTDDYMSDVGSTGGATSVPEDDDEDGTRNVFLSLRSLRSKSQQREAVEDDDVSVDGSTASSSSRYSTRSRIADGWSKISGACS